VAREKPAGSRPNCAAPGPRARHRPCRRPTRGSSAGSRRRLCSRPLWRPAGTSAAIRSRPAGTSINLVRG